MALKEGYETFTMNLDKTVNIYYAKFHEVAGRAACGTYVHYVQAATSFRGVKGGHLHLCGHVNVDNIDIFQNIERKISGRMFFTNALIEVYQTCWHVFF
jgi:hypothetical protein